MSYGWRVLVTFAVIGVVILLGTDCHDYVAEVSDASYIIKVNDQEVGSGIGVSGVVITAYHVVTTNDHVSVLRSQREEVPCDVEYTNIKCDIAVLQPRRAIPFTSWQIAEAEIGQEVFIISNPVGTAKSYSEGYVVNTHKLNEGISCIVVDCPISLGSSGAGVFTKHGELIGIVRAVNVIGGYTYIVPISSVP